MGGPDAPAAAPSAHFEDAVLHNSADFYKWHSELEATRTSETEEKFRRYAATLQGYLDACNELLGKVLATVGTTRLQDVSLHRLLFLPSAACWHLSIALALATPQAAPHDNWLC